jgi:hypothetical protein
MWKTYLCPFVVFEEINHPDPKIYDMFPPLSSKEVINLHE